MKYAIRLFVLVAFIALFLIPIANNNPATNDASINLPNNGITTSSQDDASWWNSTFIYRRYFNFTEPNVSDRANVTVNLYLTFENLHCYKDSIRVMYYNSPSIPVWLPVAFQVWNTTYYSGSDFIQSTRVTLMVNVTRGMTEGDYYIYYAKDAVGSVSFPDFYPFIYKSYTFSLINLVSYYDNNNYFIEMFDDPLYAGDGTWKNPNNVNNGVDTRWKNSQVTPSSIPNGTLDFLENIRYEPTSSSYSDFFGYYTVHSNYPLAVSMGQGDKGSNPGINDWFPGINELGNGLGMRFILGGVEGFESGNEGKYWIQAHEDATDVYVWDAGLNPDSGWSFYNSSAVTSWPAVLKAGEYIAKRDVIYTTYMIVNSTKPVSVRAGDSDASYARDIGGFFPAITGKLVGEEFYTIDMGNSNDRTRITNIGSTSVTVEWWRNTGSGWVKGANLTAIPVNGSATIPVGAASASDPEDLLRIKGPTGAKLYVEGIYTPTSVADYGDWNPTMTGNRFGTDYRIWSGRGQKIFIYAWENVKVSISSYSGTATREISAGNVDFYMPTSTSQSLHDLHSNATISIVVCGLFSTSSPYYPSGDQGYGWMVPAYSTEDDQAGLIIQASSEIKLYEFDVTVYDLDGLPVAGVSVELRNTDNSPWLDDNGLGRSGTTDLNGLIVFEGLNNQTFRIYSKIDAEQWLVSSYAHIWVTDTTDHIVQGSVTNINIQLNLASIDLHFNDLMGSPMADNPNEDTTIRLNNQTGNTNDYIAQVTTDATGLAHFYRVPQNDYDVYARYAGSLGWSYGYTDIANFASWAISSTEFTSGSFNHNWQMPLITLDLHAESWDMRSISGATMKINNSVDMNAYSISKTSDSNGDYSFYRIVNGTWNLDVWKADDYANTPLARNYTLSLPLLQDHTTQTVQLPLSQLIIRVQTGPSTYVGGAQVNVTMRGVGLVAQGVTNSTGHVTFPNIHANLTTPYSVSYNLTVKSGDMENGTLTELLAKCDMDYWYINVVYINTPTYPTGYTELNSTLYFTSKRWGQNVTFTVGLYGRAGTSTYAFTFDSSTWLNYTIYYSGIVVGWGSWNLTSHDWIADPVGIHFLVTVDTDLWLMGVSEVAYQVVFASHTNGKLDPAPMTVYVTVLPAQTSQGISTSNIIEAYGTYSEHLYWLIDTTNGGFVDNLDVYSYVVKQGTTTKTSGLLTHNLNGTYSLSNGTFTGLAVGAYYVIITLQKANYINQSIIVDATINLLPMDIMIFTPADHVWSLNTEYIYFQYQIDWNNTASNLNGVAVTIEWINYDTGLSYLNVSTTLSASGGNLTYSYIGNVLPIGNWTFRIRCSFTNYALASRLYSGFITVTAASTTLNIVTSSSLICNWTAPATFELDYKRGTTGLAGAQIITNWNGTVIVQYLGNGRYSVTFDTTIPASTYSVTLTFSLANHESQQTTVQIEILIPISIETSHDSQETPLIAYWTRSFEVIIRLLDISRYNTTIPSANVTFEWIYNGPYGTVLISSGTLTEGSSGVYSVTLNADPSVANPDVDLYRIIITAQNGSSIEISTIFLELQQVPNEIIIPIGGYVPYYGDIVTVWFYWNNTLDIAPITLPSSVSFIVEPLGVGVGGLTNYGNGTYSFNVDTKALGMSVNTYSGFYRIRISMQADGFEPLQNVFVFFLMRESPTSMVTTSVNEATWSDNLTVTVNLRDSRHNESIWLNANVAIIYGSYTIPMISLGNGTFTKAFDSSLYFASIAPEANPYKITIQYSLPNYVDGSILVDVRINAIVGEIAMITSPLQDGVYNDGSWTDVVDVQIWAFYEGTLTHLPQGIASYYWVDYPNIGGTFSYASPIYTAQIDTGRVPAGNRTLQIVITLQNHTIVPYDLLMENNPLEADFETDTVLLEAIYGTTQASDVTFTLSYGGTPLTGAEVSVQWNTVVFRHTITQVAGEYLVSIRPSQVSGLSAPSIYYLNFTLSRQNYTAAPVTIPLYLLAPTAITVDASISVEYGESITIIFQYLNILTGTSISDATVTASIVVSSTVTTPLVVQMYNTTHYYVVINAADVGEISGTPYTIRFEASASGYQSWVGSSSGYEINFYVREPTYYIPFLGRFPQSDVNNTLLLVALFGIIVGSVAIVRRMRIPYQIKQIDKALKRIENGKTAKVEKIKTMGMVISELLAPGLAELDIAAPVIESGPEEPYEDMLGGDTEDLLGELDALDDVGLEAASDTEQDFGAELEAELESIADEEPVVPAEAETIEEEVEDSKSEQEAELEFEEMESEPEAESEEILATSEVEEIKLPSEQEEVKIEAEPEKSEVEGGLETPIKADETKPEEPEEESEVSLKEEVDFDDADDSESEPEVESTKTESTETKSLSKKAMIELLPSEIKEKYSEQELRKLSKNELQELLDYMEEGHEE
jgi:hypothetical protein